MLSNSLDLMCSCDASGTGIALFPSAVCIRADIPVDSSAELLHMADASMARRNKWSRAV